MVLTAFNYKLADSAFVAVDTAAASAIAMHVFAHLQACLDRDADLTPHFMAAATLEGMSIVDKTGWP